jgi:hypothetical protein
MWVLLVVLQLFVLELLLSAYFFHKRSEHASAIIHYAVYGWERLTKTATRGSESLGIYEDDARFGYRHRPNSQGRHQTESFDVLYTIGADRERPIPAPSDPAGRILFLGSSFTFGYGVADDEPYPYLLGTSSWKDWEVVNAAVSGWGTVHAYMLLEEELDRPDLPALVLYNSIPDHVCRNYLRPRWLEMLSRSNRSHPHFELEDGRPVFQGLATLADAVRDDDVLRRKELELTEAFVLGMHERAAAKGVRFAVVLLPQRFDVACGPVAWPPSLIRSMTENGVDFLDLSELAPHMTWLEHDAHPDPEGHRVLARAIEESFIGGDLSEIAHERGPSAPSGVDAR